MDAVAAADKVNYPDCVTCQDPQYGLRMSPTHKASSRCESGKRPHCSCDTCF